MASVLDKDGSQISDMEVSEKGNWAAYCSLDMNTFLIDGKAKQKRLLLPGWSYGIQWLGTSKHLVK